MGTFTPEQLPGELRGLMLRLTHSLRVKAMFGAAQLAKTRVILQIQATKPHPPIDTGSMMRGYQVTRIKDGAMLENVTKQAIFQEHGTKPFTPPFDKLLDWARRKVRQTGAKKKRGKRRKAPGTERRGPLHGPKTIGKTIGSFQKQIAAGMKAVDQEAKAKALARKAWASIRKRGIKPKRFHEIASAEFHKDAEKAIRMQLKKITK